MLTWSVAQAQNTVAASSEQASLWYSLRIKWGPVKDCDIFSDAVSVDLHFSIQTEACCWNAYDALAHFKSAF